MKIDKTTPPSPATQIGEIAPRSPNAKPASGASSSASSVHLGTASSSVVDQGKVAAIKQAISEGRFQVNSGVVADRLIESVKQLINADKAGSV